MIEYDNAYSFHPANVKSISTHICFGELSHSSTNQCRCFLIFRRYFHCILLFVSIVAVCLRVQGRHGSIDALERSLHPLEDRRGFVKQRAITTLSLLLLLSFFRLIVKTVHRVI